MSFNKNKCNRNCCSEEIVEESHVTRNFVKPPTSDTECSDTSTSGKKKENASKDHRIHSVEVPLPDHGGKSKLKKNIKSVIVEKPYEVPTKSKKRPMYVINNFSVPRVLKFCKKTVSKDFGELINEFYDLKYFVPHNLECESFLNIDNRLKNRYDSIKCIEWSRVKLNSVPENPHGYIHANFVSTKNLQSKFILTQGPKDGTLEDFYHMVWQEDCAVIIMLCNYIETNISKCNRYVPPVNTVITFKDLSVMCIKGPSVSVFSDDDSILETILCLTLDGKKKYVTHYQHIAWTDFSVPTTSNIRMVLELLNHIRTCHHGTIIHCSAGVGRSGTLMAIEMLLCELICGGELCSAKRVVQQLRKQRGHSVQTASQYIFIHRVIIEYALINKWMTYKDVKNFCESYDKFILSEKIKKEEARNERLVTLNL
uniref:Tyrosine-protein phosphatase domain-containing protein n=1 Tax=Parastrongyloides trichosuri TaxID=131310 RepID=A0A0N4ZWF7_PARTI